MGSARGAVTRSSPWSAHSGWQVLTTYDASVQLSSYALDTCSLAQHCDISPLVLQYATMHATSGRCPCCRHPRLSMDSDLPKDVAQHGGFKVSCHSMAAVRTLMIPFRFKCAYRPLGVQMGTDDM